MFHFTWDAKNRCDRDRVKGQKWDFPGGSVVKNMPANIGDAGLIPGSGRCPGGGNGNPPQYSCLENPMDRGPDGLQPIRKLDAMTEHTQQGTEVIKKLFPLGDYT